MAMDQRSKSVRFDEINGRRIVIRWFSSICWGLLFFTILWDGILIYYFTFGFENAGMFPAPHILAGVAVTYLTLALCCNRTTVSVNDFKVRVRHWPFPWIGNKVLENEKIRQLQCVPGMTITGAAGPYKTLTNIKAILSDGSECMLLRSLDKSDALLVQRQLDKWLRAEHGTAARRE